MGVGRPRLCHGLVPEVLVYTSLFVMAWHLSTHVCTVEIPMSPSAWNKDQSPNFMATLFSGYFGGSKEKGFNHDRGAGGNHGGCPCSGPRGPGACNEDDNSDS